LPDLIVQRATLTTDPRGDGFNALTVPQALPDPRSNTIRGEDNTAASLKKHSAVLI